VSVARRLVIRERVVPDQERTGYEASVRAWERMAKAASAHFWVFEHISERGRFVEFVEAADDAALHAVLGDLPSDRWTEFQGG
jgi:hypothetical protein